MSRWRRTLRAIEALVALGYTSAEIGREIGTGPRQVRRLCDRHDRHDLTQALERNDTAPPPGGGGGAGQPARKNGVPFAPLARVESRPERSTGPVMGAGSDPTVEG